MTAPLTPEQIAELERLLELVPSADWTKTPYEDHFGQGEMLVGSNGSGKYVCHVYTAVKATAWATTQKWQAGRAAHIELIAALRNAAPALITEIKQAREGWRPIDTAPQQKVILLWALTDTDTGNWKMGAGYWMPGYGDASGCWIWDGDRLESYSQQPTHWRALPPPPEGE